MKPGKGFFAGDQLDPAALDLGVARIQHLERLGEFANITATPY